MTFAASDIETVDPPVVVATEELRATLTFGSLAFDSLPGAGDVFGGGMSSIADLGATSAADGGTEPTDAVGEAPVATGADGTDDV
jgi:hypothetical protein